MKKLLALLLVLVLAATFLTACGESGTPVDPIDAEDIAVVTASTALNSSNMYVITDESAIKELVDIYNSIRYEPVPDEVPELARMEMYFLNFSKSYESGAVGEPLAKIGISPKEGYVLVTDSGWVCKLTSSFDEARLKSILEEYNIA